MVEVEMNKVDTEYLRLVKDVLDNGTFKPTRGKINNVNIGAYSVFGRQARFTFDEGFPILTTKKVAFKTLAHELIWFLRGESNIKYLKDNNVNIWDAWADQDGELGFGTYGTLWRTFPFHCFHDDFKKHYPDMLEDYCMNSFENIEKYQDPEQRKNWHYIHHMCYEDDVDGSVDQIKQLIQNIEMVKQDQTASCGRRLIVSAWHPYYVDKVGLPPCHVMFQFNVTDDKLSLQLYQRSCDLFLGVPFNISSYCLLLAVIAHITNLVPHEFIHTYGDLHIYNNHVDQMQEQLKRSGYKLPQLKIDPSLRSVDNIHINDFTLENYQHDSVLKGEVAV